MSSGGNITGGRNVIGNLNVSGNVSKGGGNFKIDHPLDPANRYPNHSFVESPGMKSIYDGIVVLDKHGKAVVQLPDYLEALNQDCGYPVAHRCRQSVH